MNPDFVATVTAFFIQRPRLVRIMTKLHVFFYRISGGRLFGSPLGVPVLLLDHRGRRSGKTFTIPLYYLVDGDRMAVVASAAGSPEDPQWWRNLQAAGGRGRVQVGSVQTDVQATVASAEERERLWPRFVEVYPAYESYRRATTREIPIVLLHPVR